MVSHLVPRTSERRHLERKISTLLQTLDALETEAEDPDRSQALAPELAHANLSLTTTVRALRALAHVPHAPMTRPARRRSVSRPVHSRQPSANAYFREPPREP
jgi:hypothetical protein